MRRGVSGGGDYQPPFGVRRSETAQTSGNPDHTVHVCDAGWCRVKCSSMSDGKPRRSCKIFRCPVSAIGPSLCKTLHDTQDDCAHGLVCPLAQALSPGCRPGSTMFDLSCRTAKGVCTYPAAATRFLPCLQSLCRVLCPCAVSGCCATRQWRSRLMLPGWQDLAHPIWHFAWGKYPSRFLKGF